MENKQYCNFNGFMEKDIEVDNLSPIRFKTKIECGFCEGPLFECVYAKRCQYKIIGKNGEDK